MPVRNSIHIAAALIEDGNGRLLLVRKTGTPWFMQAGGKIEDGEDASTALRRELEEEIGLSISDEQFHYLGRFSASAANEENFIVDAEIFHIRTLHVPVPHAEIEEALWASHAEAEALPLAPLTRGHILPLFQAL